ncbi:MAG: hypothetical protein MUF16_18105 [Burkholderiaceae bacterium]|jgi:hypothetical protein|nr:hypothetical protein [Burkholderiaceae bacterium]
MKRVATGGWRFWLLTVMAGGVVVLVLVNYALLQGNRHAQTELAQHQQAINQGAMLGRLGDQLIRSLATQAAETNDAQIRDLLASQGITFSVQQNPEGPGVAAPAGSPPGAPAVPAQSGGQ